MAASIVIFRGEKSQAATAICTVLVGTATTGCPGMSGNSSSIPAAGMQGGMCFKSVARIRKSSTMSIMMSDGA
jgi:hypothetical protein